MNSVIKQSLQGLLLCLGGLTFTAQAVDGTIKTKVKFIQFTCDLTTASKNMSVPLGDINRSQLAKKGDRSPQVFFEVKATGCPTTSQDTGVILAFSGTAPPKDNEAFVLDTGSTVSGLAVKIAHSGYAGNYDKFVTPNSKYERDQRPNSDGETIFKYAAQYVALNDNVTPGTANLTTQIDLYYW